jgi:hypothetical protein
MPKINTTKSGHAGPAATSGWQWLPYSNETHLNTLKRAITIINNKIKGDKPCNQAFRALPGRRTFAQVWTDPSVWLSFDPRRTNQLYGATLGKEITITEYSLAMGRWTVAATLVHELAHVNGASGTDTKAEDTLKKCLLKGLHDPNIIGKIVRKSPRRLA